MHSNRLPRSNGNHSALAFDKVTLNAVRGAAQLRAVAAVAVLTGLLAVAASAPPAAQSAGDSLKQSTLVPLAGRVQASTLRSADTLPNAVAQKNKALEDKAIEGYLEYSRYVLG